MREQRIETVLKISPELIDLKFKGCQVERQLIRGKSRLDLLIHMRRGSAIVEIKKEILTIDDVNQLLGYCRNWCKHGHFSISHNTYLVGLPPKDEKSLLPQTNSVFKVHLRYLGIDVPMLVQEKDEGGYERWVMGSKKKAIRLFHI